MYMHTHQVILLFIRYVSTFSGMPMLSFASVHIELINVQIKRTRKFRLSIEKNCSIIPLKSKLKKNTSFHKHIYAERWGFHFHLVNMKLNHITENILLSLLNINLHCQNRIQFSVRYPIKSAPSALKNKSKILNWKKKKIKINSISSKIKCI